MTEDNKSPNKTQQPTSQPPQPSNPGSKERGVLGSKYLASEEEHQQLKSSYGSELVITMSNANPGQQPQKTPSSNPGSKDRGVWGAKSLASEEERRQFANSYGSELVITTGRGKPGQK
jgi:hypothetical protein